MSLKRKLLASALALSALLPLTAGIAAAAPKGEPFPITCGGETVMIVTPDAQGTFTPGFVLDSTTRLIPVSFHFVVTQNGEVIMEETSTKGASLHALEDKLTTCTFSETFDGITFTGTVKVLMTPQGGRDA